MINQKEDVIYEYSCRSCPEKIRIKISDYHLDHKCLFCGSSYSAPAMYFNEKLTRPIQPDQKR